MLKVTENPVCRWPEDRPLQTDSGDWWIARVKPRHEKALARDLASLGVGYFLPMMTRRTIRRDNNKPRKSVICLFPGYISLVGYHNRKNELLRTSRILNVIEIFDQDRFVAEIEAVQKALSSPDCRLHPGLATGAEVVIVSGPMEGVHGVVQDMSRPDRIFLNVRMFNRAISVTVSQDQVEPCEGGLV